MDRDEIKAWQPPWRARPTEGKRMSIPTNAEVLALLDRLDAEVADDLETPWIDFKPWTSARDDMRTAVEYAVCFANAQGGVVVFGVASDDGE